MPDQWCHFGKKSNTCLCTYAFFYMNTTNHCFYKFAFLVHKDYYINIINIILLTKYINIVYKITHFEACFQKFAFLHPKMLLSCKLTTKTNKRFFNASQLQKIDYSFFDSQGRLVSKPQKTMVTVTRGYKCSKGDPTRRSTQQSVVQR